MTKDRRGQRRRELGAAATGILAAVLLAGMLGGTAGTVSAANATNVSEKAPMYDNSTQNVSFEFWFDEGNVSLDVLGDMASRLGPAIIGTGNEDPSGTGFVGVLLLGLVIAGSVLVSVMGTGIGPVGGTIVGLVLGYGMIAVGLAPAWAWPLLLFGLGIVAAVAAIRILRA